MTTADSVPNTSPLPRLLDKRQVADLLRLSPVRVTYLARTGAIPAPFRLGENDRHRPLWLESDLTAFIQLRVGLRDLDVKPARAAFKPEVVQPKRRRKTRRHG